MWWAWTAVCLSDLLALHLLQASGLQCFLAFLFAASSRKRRTGGYRKPQPRQQSTALVPASHDVAVIVLDREAA